MTPSFERGSVDPSGCPCGRSHPPTGVSRRQPPRTPEFTEALASRLWEAGLTAEDRDPNGVYDVRYASDCERPFVVKTMDFGRLFARQHFRCRKCPPCLEARKRYWIAAAVHQTNDTRDAGLRTWFGTLTFRTEVQDELLMRAKEKHPAPNAEWWDEPFCDERFRLVREEALREVQLYWKRLRKAGHRFKYFLVFERHKSGLPHMHWLLHEADAPIRKKDLQGSWPHGFTKVVLVGGRSKRSGPPEKAAFYVAKYLSKEVQARQVASHGYRPIRGRRKRSSPKKRSKP